MKLLEADRTAVGNLLIANWSSAPGPCTIDFYTQSQPTGPSVGITTQTKLGTLVCSDPLATCENGIITFNLIADDISADNTGVCIWARLVDGSGVARIDFDVTDTAGSGAIKINDTNIVFGGTLQITSAIIVIGGA